MAQTRERERAQPAAKSPPKAAQRTNTPSPSTPTSPAPWRNWLSRLRSPVTNAPGPDGQPRQRVGGTLFKSFFGILIWFVASQLIMYGLILLDGALTKPGQLPPLESTRLLPPNTPLLGWMTPFLLLYGGAVIGLWFLLIRFNLIPRDFFGGRAQARAQAQERARRQSGGGASATSGASTGPRKTRAQRRYAETQTQANVKSNGKTSGNRKTAAKPAAKPATTKSAKVNDTAASANDHEYDRVRSADRQRRRRESKR